MTSELSTSLASKGLTKLDAKILKGFSAGKSPQEVGKELGIPPEQAVLRNQTILRSRDVWTDLERFQMFLADVYALKDVLQEKVETYGAHKDDTGNLIKILGLLATTLDKQSQVSDELTNKVSQANARFMMELIVRAFDYAKALLKEEYPEVDVRAIEGAFRQGLAEVTSESDD